jgi:hypothetical protein
MLSLLAMPDEYDWTGLEFAIVPEDTRATAHLASTTMVYRSSSKSSGVMRTHI